MEELGYIDAPVQRLGRLSDQRWRAARIMLDVSLHTKGMSVGKPVSFLVRRCGLEPDPALAEVQRYTSSPTLPQSYLMGKLAILDLADDYRQAHPQASRQEITTRSWRADRCRRDLCAGGRWSPDDQSGQSAGAQTRTTAADLAHLIAWSSRARLYPRLEKPCVPNSSPTRR